MRYREGSAQTDRVYHSRMCDERHRPARRDRMQLCALAVLGCASLAAPAAANPWPQIADGDLATIHQLLLDNHPGPVDPQNPNYRVWFEGGYRQAQGMPLPGTSTITNA